MSSAKMAATPDGKMAFSPFEQGHGMVNAYDAVASRNTGCANRGLNIKDDLAGVNHFAGPARLKDDGTFAIYLGGEEVLSEGHQWGDTGMFSEGHQWGDTGIFSEGHQWGDTGIFSEGHQWGDTGILNEGHQWGDTGIFSEGHQWGDTGIFSEGHQWGDTGLFAESLNSGDTSDSLVINEDGEVAINEWVVEEQAEVQVPVIE